MSDKPKTRDKQDRDKEPSDDKLRDAKNQKDIGKTEDKFGTNPAQGESHV